MKNFSKILEAMRSIALIALVAIIGFSMTGCGGDDGGPPSTNGRLTITGLDDYEGKYVVALYGSSYVGRYILAAAGFNDDRTLIDAVKVSGGTATLKVWEITNSARAYNGTELMALDIYIFDNTPAVYERSFQDVYKKEEVGVYFDEGVAAGEMYVASVEAQLSDVRFNGTFKHSTSSSTWVFDGSNKATYTYDDNPLTYEIKLVDGHLRSRLWSNRYSQWSDGVAYSFSTDGKTLTLGSSTYTKQE